MSGKRLGKTVPEQKMTGTSGTGTPQRKRKSKKKKARRIYRILIAITAVLLALCIGVLAWFKTSFSEKPTVNAPGNENSSDSDSEDLNEIGKPVRTSGDKKEDFYTFLVIGRDTGGGGNTDTVLLVSYDVAGQEMNVMSIPRDTMVNVSWDVKKINAVYNFYGGGDKGIEALGKEISQLVGFVPDFQVILEWKAVGELVDALGGVTYDVPRNMYYVDPTQNLKINVKKGVQKLSGSQAMQVVRFRDGPNGYANGDLGRIETQQGFLKAVMQQCLSISNLTRINELAKVFTDNVKTNLTVKNLAWFADKAVLQLNGLKMENVHFYTMPCENARVWSRSYHQKLSYVVPKTEELVELVNSSFNPYIDPLKSYELDIMELNSDGTIASSTGKLEDTKANASLPTSSTTKISSNETKQTETKQTETKQTETKQTETKQTETKQTETKQTETKQSNETSNQGGFIVERPSDTPTSGDTEPSELEDTTGANGSSSVSDQTADQNAQTPGLETTITEE
jgi:LCP family protein required for cell wall assembly